MRSKNLQGRLTLLRHREEPMLQFKPKGRLQAFRLNVISQLCLPLCCASSHIKLLAQCLTYIKIEHIVRCCSLSTVILATQETEARWSQVGGLPGQLNKILPRNKNKMVGDIAQWQNCNHSK